MNRTLETLRTDMIREAKKRAFPSTIYQAIISEKGFFQLIPPNKGIIPLKIELFRQTRR